MAREPFNFQNLSFACSYNSKLKVVTILVCRDELHASLHTKVVTIVLDISGIGAFTNYIYPICSWKIFRMVRNILFWFINSFSLLTMMKS